MVWPLLEKFRGKKYQKYQKITKKLLKYPLRPLDMLSNHVLFGLIGSFIDLKKKS